MSLDSRRAILRHCVEDRAGAVKVLDPRRKDLRGMKTEPQLTTKVRPLRRHRRLRRHLHRKPQREGRGSPGRTAGGRVRDGADQNGVDPGQAGALELGLPGRGTEEDMVSHWTTERPSRSQFTLLF